MRYNESRHKTEVGTTKRNKIRTVDFCDTLAAILNAARTGQLKNRHEYEDFYSLNYCRQVQELVQKRRALRPPFYILSSSPRCRA